MFTGKFYKTFMEEIVPNLNSLFQKIERDRILSNSFYKAPILRSSKDIIRKENYRSMSLMNIDAKILKQNISQLNPTML